MVAARVEWSPQGDAPADESPYAAGATHTRFVLGAAGYYGQLARGVFRVDPITGVLGAAPTGVFLDFAGEVDAQLYFGRWGFAAEFDLGRREPRPPGMPAQTPYAGCALTGQASVFVYRDVLQVAARGSFLEPSFDAQEDLFAAGEAQVAWFAVGTALVLKLRYGFTYQQPNNALWLVTPGLGHIVTLQVQGYF